MAGGERMTELTLKQKIKLLIMYKAARETRGCDDNYLAELQKDNLVRISLENSLKIAETTTKGLAFLAENPAPE